MVMKLNPTNVAQSSAPGFAAVIDAIERRETLVDIKENRMVGRMTPRLRVRQPLDLHRSQGRPGRGRTDLKCYVQRTIGLARTGLSKLLPGR